MRRTAFLLFLLTTIWCLPVIGQTERQAAPTGIEGPDWAAITGTWILESADRDGQALPGMQDTRYFLEPGLMRWANPNVKSEVTKMPIMMGRLLKQIEGSRFRTGAIYPPAANADVEIAVEGDAMAMILQAGEGKPILTITLKRKNQQSPKPRKDRLIGLAKKALQEGKRDAAYQFTQLQLINFPDDKEAALLLADTRLQAALEMKSKFNAVQWSRTKAQGHWALDKYPEEHALRHLFGAFLFRYMQFDEASKQYEILEEAGQFEPDSMFRHAQAEMRLGNQDAAKKLLHQMIGYDPAEGGFTGRERIKEPNSGFLLLATMLAGDGNSEAAVAVVDRFVERFPNLPKAYLDRGRFYLSQNEMEKARGNFSKAMEIGPNDLEATLVNIEMSLQQPGDEADKLIEKTFATHGRDLVLVLLAATRAGIKKEFDKSLALVDEGLASEPGHQSLLSLKVRLLMQKGDYDAANELIDELPSLGVPPPAAQLVRAKLLITTKKFSQATRVLADIDTSKMPAGFAGQVENVRKELEEAIKAAAPGGSAGDD